MWSNQSGVLDVTIQCQLNMATRNLQEITTNIAPIVEQNHPSTSTDTARSNTNWAITSGSLSAPRTMPSCYENITPTKSFSSCDYATDGNFTNVFMTPTTNDASQPMNSKVKQGQSMNCSPNFNSFMWNNFPSQQYYGSQFLNDSGYSSPGLNYSEITRSSCSNDNSNAGHASTPKCVPQNVTPNSVWYDQKFSASCSFRNTFGATFAIPGNNVLQEPTYAIQNSADNDSLDEDMKIAMKEKDVSQRIFSLKTKGYESAQEVEEFYQQQTTLIDIERHNILRQMAFDKTSSASIHVYYNRKLLSILENVDDKLSELEKRKLKCKQLQKKSRLLPKAAVKILESWYQENLSNPYPSREVTLSMASEGGITVEQIRKWFANKRNRSRNSKLKACDAENE